MYSSLKKKLFSQSSSSSYLIPIILLICSFVIYSFNLGGQPGHGDEILYLAWGVVYFDLIKEGNFDNSCFKNLEDCDGILFNPSRGFEINYTPIRNTLVGFGQYLTAGESKGDLYNWSCKWYPCFDSANGPSSEELSSGRFFSAIFGSLTIVLAFFIK